MPENIHNPRISLLSQYLEILGLTRATSHMHKYMLVIIIELINLKNSCFFYYLYLDSKMCNFLATVGLSV